MYKYLVYGIIAESDIKLPECEAVAVDEPAEITIRAASFGDVLKKLEELDRGYLESRGPDCILPSRYDRQNEDEIFVFLRKAGCFRASGTGLLEYEALIDTESNLFHQWLLCLGITLVMIRRKIPVLHGASMLVPGTDKAIIISGDSGAGKSTISNALLGRGLLFISDDSIGLDRTDGKVVITGSYPQRRICADVAEQEDVSGAEFYEEGFKQKWLFDMNESYYGGTPHSFDKLFILTVGDSSRVTVREVTGIEKLKTITECLYKYTYYRAQGMPKEMLDLMLAAIGQAKFYVVERPSEGNTVDEITELIYRMSVE